MIWDGMWCHKRTSVYYGSATNTSIPRALAPLPVDAWQEFKLTGSAMPNWPTKGALFMRLHPWSWCELSESASTPVWFDQPCNLLGLRGSHCRHFPSSECGALSLAISVLLSRLGQSFSLRKPQFLLRCFVHSRHDLPLNAVDSSDPWPTSTLLFPLFRWQLPVLAVGLCLQCISTPRSHVNRQM